MKRSGAVSPAVARCYMSAESLTKARLVRLGDELTEEVMPVLAAAG